MRLPAAQWPGASSNSVPGGIRRAVGRERVGRRSFGTMEQARAAVCSQRQSDPRCHLDTLRRIEWDETQPGRVPLLVIDGREVSWDEVGRMLMSFEGWQFRLEIRDRSEEV
jgi:hypothetical protein